MSKFASRLLEWHDKCGRKDLPWQQEATLYRVWISEIMLQQTQVATVIPYYLRFIQRFPDVATLAGAAQNEVLALWSGLGYYSRARNLLKAARVVQEQYAGNFPDRIDEVMALPGIGRSTAGAILSLAMNQCHPILDGNVKRVLARYHAVDGWPGKKMVENRLWQLAESHTPTTQNARYTQAIMDLGATVCSRSRPDCGCCPLEHGCRARREGTTGHYPAPKPPRSLPVRESTFLIIANNAGEILLQQRPPSGIWGGLWSFPECPAERDPEQWCEQVFGVVCALRARWPETRHTFSHFHLDIQPLYIEVNGVGAGKVMEGGTALWYKTESFEQLGLPAPVKRLLARYRNNYKEQMV